MKGALKENHIPVNNYEFLVLGLPPLTPVAIGGIEDELETVELPDRTVASGGNRMSGEFDLTLAAHHSIENVAMETWFIESQGAVSPTYKKECVLIQKTLEGKPGRTYNLISVFPKKRTTSTLEMENAGEQAVIVWTMSFDDVLPIL